MISRIPKVRLSKTTIFSALERHQARVWDGRRSGGGYVTRMRLKMARLRKHMTDWEAPKVPESIDILFSGLDYPTPKGGLDTSDLAHPIVASYWHSRSEAIGTV